MKKEKISSKLFQKGFLEMSKTSIVRRCPCGCHHTIDTVDTIIQQVKSKGDSLHVEFHDALSSVTYLITIRKNKDE